MLAMLEAFFIHMAVFCHPVTVYKHVEWMYFLGLEVRALRGPHSILQELRM